VVLWVHVRLREAAVFVSERASQARRAEERSERADERGPCENAQRFRGVHVRLREEAVFVSEVGAK
jgi:hypothetical protein